jgi:FlaA1/EpsC-like NDP-sugar epimerase
MLADFILILLKMGKTAVYIPNQRCVVLSDLVKAFLEVWGNTNTKIKKLGLRKREILHEKLYLPNEAVVTEMENRSSKDIEKMGIDEIKQLLLKAKECI